MVEPFKPRITDAHLAEVAHHPSNRPAWVLRSICQELQEWRQGILTKPGWADDPVRAAGFHASLDRIRALRSAAPVDHTVVGPRAGGARYFAERMQDPVYAAAYHAARERIDANQRGANTDG